MHAPGGFREASLSHLGSATRSFSLSHARGERREAAGGKRKRTSDFSGKPTPRSNSLASPPHADAEHAETQKGGLQAKAPKKLTTAALLASDSAANSPGVNSTSPIGGRWTSRGEAAKRSEAKRSVAGASFTPSFPVTPLLAGAERRLESPGDEAVIVGDQRDGRACDVILGSARRQRHRETETRGDTETQTARVRASVVV